jgi:hypothetical protein
MTWIIAVLAGWLLCSLMAYFLHRAEVRLRYGEWTANDRAEGKILAAFGPIGLGLAINAYLQARRDHALGQTWIQRFGKQLVLAAVLVPAGAAVAGDYGYSHRGCYGYSYGQSYGHADYSYSYHNAGWWHGKWYPAGYYYYHPGGYWYMKGYGAHYGYDYPHYEEKVKVIYKYKEVEPDYYASVRDSYRDWLLANAIANMVNTKQTALPPQTLPEYGADRPVPRAAREPAVNTPVSPALKEYVAQSCVKCHNGPGGKGGVDLSRLESAPAGLRWACHGMVVSGEMPQGGPEAPEAVLKEFYDWAKAATKSQRAAQAVPDKKSDKQPQPPKEKSHAPKEDALAARSPGNDRDPARKRK